MNTVFLRQSEASHSRIAGYHSTAPRSVATGRLRLAGDYVSPACPVSFQTSIITEQHWLSTHSHPLHELPCRIRISGGPLYGLPRQNWQNTLQSISICATQLYDINLYLALFIHSGIQCTGGCQVTSILKSRHYSSSADFSAASISRYCDTPFLEVTR